MPPNYTSNVDAHLGRQKSDTNGSENEDKFNEISETQPDFQSIKGVFGWTVIDRVNIPYILRKDQQFVAVRIVERKLLSHYPNAYPDDLGKHAPLTSSFITISEAKLLNEINLQHCAGEYGKKDFTTKDLIVLLSDFVTFFNLVKKTFSRGDVARLRAACPGSARWLQIKNTVTPYVVRPDGRYVPLSVIQYAAGLLTYENVSGVSATLAECEMLNEACKNAGVEFVFTDTATRLININNITRLSPIDVIELPSRNPLKHATYMELPTTCSAQVSENMETVTRLPQIKVSQLSQQLPASQAYRFEPNIEQDMMRNSFRSRISVNEQTVCVPSMSLNPQYPGNQMIDPRMSHLYRMQHPMPNKPMMKQNAGMSNILPSCYGSHLNQNVSPRVNPMLRFYQNLINNQQPKSLALTNPATERVPEPPRLPTENSIDLNNHRSPGSCSNPSPWPCPPQSRPSSGQRPPSGSSISSPAHAMSPPAHVLSPPPSRAGPNAMSAITHSTSDKTTSGCGGQPPSCVALQLIQNMCTKRFPGALPLVPPGTSTSEFSFSKQDGASHAIPSLFPHFRDPLLLSQSRTVTKSNVPEVNSLLNQIRPGQGLQPSANPEIPRLFTPTGTSVVYQVPPTSQTVLCNSVASPPSLRMRSPAIAQPYTLCQNAQGVLTLPQPRPITQQQLLPPQTVSTVKQTSHGALVNCIKGAWLNNRSISCLCLEQEGRNGRFCLVEAVCKLYFNGCSVHEFLFALENVLNVPLLTCSDAEEKAFIQYYSLPVDALKCNRMIKFGDLENFFSQLTYMFPSIEAKEQGEGDFEQETIQEIERSSGPSPAVNGVVLITAQIEAAIPTSISNSDTQRGEKRLSDIFNKEPAPKQRCERSRSSDYDYNVIILD